MPDTILQTYLNNQFIKTTDPENITKLKKAVSEIQKRLAKQKYKIISYTLVAIDPNISEREPVVIEVEKIIIAKWATFKNAVSTTKDTPINYIRAVILEALIGLTKNEDHATIIWHTGRNIVSYYKIGKKEQEIIENLLNDVGRNIEIASRTYWGINNSPEVTKFKSIDINIEIGKSAKINEADLTNEIGAAAIHTAWSTQTGKTGENPYTQAQNNWNWPNFFSERSAKGIAKEVNKALSSQNIALNSISTSLKSELDNYFSNLQPYFEQISNTLTQGVVANNKRSELLWWKQSLYSPTLNQSYRKLTTLESAITMAVDLNNFVDPIYPVSVDFLLMETLKDVFGEKIDTQLPLTDIFNEATDLGQNIKDLIQSLVKVTPGRKSLGIAIANHLFEDIDSNVFKETGISKNATVSFAELTTWIFHDLQAVKLASTK